MTVASIGTGVGEVVDRFEEHLVHLEGHAGLESRRRKRLERHLEDLLHARLWSDFRDRLAPRAWDEVVSALAARKVTPHQAAQQLLADARSARIDADE